MLYLDLSAVVKDPSASLGLVQALLPIGAKLVGSTGKSKNASGYLASKVVALQRQAIGVYLYILP